MMSHIATLKARAANAGLNAATEHDVQRRCWYRGMEAAYEDVLALATDESRSKEETA